MEKPLVIHSLTSRIGPRAWRYGVFCFYPILTACASAPVEWIDVPLADHVYFETRPAYREDEVEIPVPANSDLEYMLDMKEGYSVSYEWRSTDISNPELLLAEFHGHTVRDSEEPGNVMFFKQGRGETSNGFWSRLLMVYMGGTFRTKRIAISLSLFHFPVFIQFLTRTSFSIGGLVGFGSRSTERRHPHQRRVSTKLPRRHILPPIAQGARHSVGVWI